jgi:hypothetical protein
MTRLQRGSSSSRVAMNQHGEDDDGDRHRATDRHHVVSEA